MDWVFKFKERIKESRIESGYSMRAFAEKLGVSLQSVYKWESKKNKFLPNIDHLIELCRVTGKTPNWLLTGKE